MTSTQAPQYPLDVAESPPAGTTPGGRINDILSQIEALRNNKPALVQVKPHMNKPCTNKANILSILVTREARHESC